MARRGIDPFCWRLAEHFLSDNLPEWWAEAQREDFTTDLAEEIQDAVEDWFLAKECGAIAQRRG